MDSNHDSDESIFGEHEEDQAEGGGQSSHQRIVTEIRWIWSERDKKYKEEDGRDGTIGVDM